MLKLFSQVSRLTLLPVAATNGVVLSKLVKCTHNLVLSSVYIHRNNLEAVNFS